MDYLSFYDVETASDLTTLDLGAVAYMSSDDTLLRVLNNNALYQAEDVVVAFTGTDDLELWLSDDGENFAASLVVGDIPPSGSSGTFWLRRVTPSSGAPGNRTASITATAAGWTTPIDTSTSENIPLDADVPIDATESGI